MSQKYNLVAKNVGVVGTGAQYIATQSDRGQQMNFLGGLISSGNMVISGGMGSYTSIGHTNGSVTLLLDGKEIIIPAPAGRIEVKNNKVYQNGVEYKLDGVDESKVLRIAELRVIVNESVKGDVKSDNGNIEVHGSVTGNVSSSNGNIDVSGGVDGNVSSSNGNISVDGDVTGSASSSLGDVKAHKFGDIQSRRHRRRD